MHQGCLRADNLNPTKAKRDDQYNSVIKLLSTESLSSIDSKAYTKHSGSRLKSRVGRQPTRMNLYRGKYFDTSTSESSVYRIMVNYQ